MELEQKNSRFQSCLCRKHPVTSQFQDFNDRTSRNLWFTGLYALKSMALVNEAKGTGTVTEFSVY
jgi:hypothetical protein